MTQEEQDRQVGQLVRGLAKSQQCRAATIVELHNIAEVMQEVAKSIQDAIGAKKHIRLVHDKVERVATLSKLLEDYESLEQTVDSLANNLHRLGIKDLTL